jgi:hypothetical protein
VAAFVAVQLGAGPGDPKRSGRGEHRVVPGGQPERPRVAELGRLQTAGTKVLGPAAYRPHRRDVPGLMHKLQVCPVARAGAATVTPG